MTVYFEHLRKMGFNPKDITKILDSTVNWNRYEYTIKYELDDLDIVNYVNDKADCFLKGTDKKILPFGLNNGKICVPSYYSWIKEKDPATGEMKIDGNLDLELIYNLTMLSGNINYWYLLRFDQKWELYSLLKDYSKKKVFCALQVDFTFGDLYALLLRIVSSFDPAIDAIITSRDPNLTKEEKKLLEQNFEEVRRLDLIGYPFDTKIDFYQLQNLMPYRAFIWEFVENFVIVDKFDNERRLDARPVIKTIYFNDVQ